MIKIINQRNPRYSNLELGKSGVGFNRCGCTTSAVKAGIEYVTGKEYTADKVVDFLKYTDKKSYPNYEAGLIVWGASNFPGLGVEFIKRTFCHHLDERATEYTKKLKNKKGFMVLALDNDSHFVLLKNWSWLSVPWCLVEDSWRKNIYMEKGVVRPISKSRISGYVIFHRL